MEDNMKIYVKLQNTPQDARKPISAGRLKGFTDINPMFRIKRMTEVFGPCGVGWYVVPKIREIIPGENGESKAFVQLAMYIKTSDESYGWSAPIYGEGGASFIANEKNGPYTDDEAFKKAFTDALGSCCKLLGMSADIYYDKDRTKYTAPAEDKPKTEEKPKAEQKKEVEQKEEQKPEQKKTKRKPTMREAVDYYAKIQGTTATAEYKKLEKELGKPYSDENKEEYYKAIMKKIGELKNGK